MVGGFSIFGVMQRTIGSLKGVTELETVEQMTAAVKTYILKEFLPGEDPKELADSTPLITGGILDSLATLKLVAFLEERYQIELQAHEVDVEHLNTISDIANLVRSKL
jgi:acyl carrier protein